MQGGHHLWLFGCLLTHVTQFTWNDEWWLMWQLSVQFLSWLEFQPEVERLLFLTLTQEKISRNSSHYRACVRNLYLRVQSVLSKRAQNPRLPIVLKPQNPRVQIVKRWKDSLDSTQHLDRYFSQFRALVNHRTILRVLSTHNFGQMLV
jgi:hypothetical protein